MHNEFVLTTIACQTLRELWLHVLYRCNLSCSHCLFECGPGKEGPGELSLNECRDLIMTARVDGVESIYLTGGEPMLWRDLRQFLNWFYSLEDVLPLTILTNGTLIDDELAEFLGQYASHGLKIRISLECYTQKNNDAFRGDGSFAKTIKGIKHLNAHGVRPWIAYVNKSGGSLDCDAEKKLEADFGTVLGKEHGLQIAGLKVMAAYSKGRFAGRVDHSVSKEMVEELRDKVQCSYGVAVSKNGTYSCPILVDHPEARLSGSLADVIGRPVELTYPFCSSCFATGTTCGQRGQQF